MSEYVLPYGRMEKQPVPASQKRITRLLCALENEVRKHGGDSVIFLYGNREDDCMFFQFGPDFDDREQAILIEVLSQALLVAGKRIAALQSKRVM